MLVGVPGKALSLRNLLTDESKREQQDGGTEALTDGQGALLMRGQ